MTRQISDAYAHCGLSKWRPVEDVDRVMDRFGVPRAVLVQHLGEFDNTYIETIVAARPERFAGVMLVDTEADNARENLAQWAGKGRFRGIRLLARSLDANPTLWDDVARLGLNIIVCDTATLAKNKGVGKVLSMNTCAPPNGTAATAAITEPPRTTVAALSRLPYRVCLPHRRRRLDGELQREPAERPRRGER